MAWHVEVVHARSTGIQLTAQKGLFLNKVVRPGYFEHLKTFVGPLNRGISRKVALDQSSPQRPDYISRNGRRNPKLSCSSMFPSSFTQITVQCLMGPDFYQRNGKQLYGLLRDAEADISNMLNLLLRDWMPHPAARRLRQSKEKTFMERLRTRDKRPQRSKNAYDYVSYTLGDTHARTSRNSMPLTTPSSCLPPTPSQSQVSRGRLPG